MKQNCRNGLKVAFLTVGIMVLAVVTGQISRYTTQQVVAEMSTPVDRTEYPIEPSFGYTPETIRQIVAPYMPKEIWERDLVEVNLPSNVIVVDGTGRIDNTSVYLPLYSNYQRLEGLERYCLWQSANPQSP